MTTFEDLTYMEQHRAITDAVTKAVNGRFDVEGWDTGGGCLVTTVVLRRGGTPITRMGEPTGDTHSTRHIMVTWDGPEGGWICCLYDEGPISDDHPEYWDGVDLDLTHIDAVLGLDAMATQVATYADRYQTANPKERVR